MCIVHTEEKWEVSVQNWQRYGGNKCEILWNFEAFEYFILLSELCRHELQSNCYVFIFYVKVCYSARSICENNERKWCIFHLFVSLNDSKWSSRDLWCLMVLYLQSPTVFLLLFVKLQLQAVDTFSIYKITIVSMYYHTLCTPNLTLEPVWCTVQAQLWCRHAGFFQQRNLALRKYKAVSIWYGWRKENWPVIVNAELHKHTTVELHVLPERPTTLCFTLVRSPSRVDSPTWLLAGMFHLCPPMPGRIFEGGYL